MLILSRKVGEEIIIGDGITIAINRISGDRVTLAFRAPQDVRILRGELKKLMDAPPKDLPPGETRAVVPEKIRARFSSNPGISSQHFVDHS